MAVSELNESLSNSMPGRWLSIVGIGEDGIEGLSPIARRLIEDANLVVGGRRHLDLADTLIRGDRLSWPSPIDGAYADILARRGEAVVVLASGDPFHFGIGKQLAALVDPDEIACVPQPSAFSLAAARMGWALQDVTTLSLHGRPLDRIIPALQPGARVLALTWDETTPAKLADLLKAREMGQSRITVLERLGGPKERARAALAESFDLDDIDPLNIVAVEVVAEAGAPFIGLAPGLDDALFESDGQLTKREVRAVTLSSLAPRRGELLWDIGLGSGSVAIEWLLRDPAMRAIGFEEDPERAARAARNAASLGVSQLEIVQGKAPKALEGLPPPDAVFVGGGLSDGVLDAVWSALKPGGRLVANAVTLEGERTLFDGFETHGGSLSRIDIARLDQVGRLHGWRPAMPITHWRVAKPEVTKP
ncbi:Precorrin-6Y C(5,15)-methyltransferase [decarboxylating] [Methyloligella halotolerans]|uniref:Precorrin-6Y C(5,15)-methyltransferase [decarboxylating] n=1 Tax=Methyloligella halotolerans TaxID=1177755 RepID=A0A1E2S1P8_9HYPH|nr:precorrin-6y C5,15-methyltransferase (decarboxylating) subunit CbiE [Methyloligella halotolerans]ODA68259.1 Precorrin-6Y C(5,15)-methyltransferase [decarboxylating] [Methyloligella halotolerans]